MRTRWIVAPVFLVTAACNELALDEPTRRAPPQASVVTSSGAITVHWTPEDDAGRYDVLLSISSEAAGTPGTCEGQGGETRSPCTIAGNTPGQLYYVRVKSYALDGETDDDPEDADLPSLAVRAGFANIPPTPFTWPGVGVTSEEDDSSIELKGLWFEDDAPGSPEHACYTYWDTEERKKDPCRNEDLRVGVDDPDAFRFGSCFQATCYVTFEVEANDGRSGQSYTRVTRR